jgi:hypothetical protein
VSWLNQTKSNLKNTFENLTDQNHQQCALKSAVITDSKNLQRHNHKRNKSMIYAIYNTLMYSYEETNLFMNNFSSQCSCSTLATISLDLSLHSNVKFGILSCSVLFYSLTSLNELTLLHSIIFYVSFCSLTPLCAQTFIQFLSLFFNSSLDGIEK